MNTKIIMLLLVIVTVILCDNPMRKLVGYANHKPLETVFINDDASYLTVLNTLLEKYSEVKLFNYQSYYEATFLSANKTQEIGNRSRPHNCHCSGNPVKFCTCALSCSTSHCCYNSRMKEYYTCEVSACCYSGSYDYGCPSLTNPTCEWDCGGYDPMCKYGCIN